MYILTTGHIVVCLAIQHDTIKRYEERTDLVKLFFPLVEAEISSLEPLTKTNCHSDKLIG